MIKTYKRRMERLEQVARQTKHFKYTEVKNPYYMAIYLISRDMFIYHEFKENKKINVSDTAPVIVINADKAHTAQELADAAFYGILERKKNGWYEPQKGWQYPALTVVDLRKC